MPQRRKLGKYAVGAENEEVAMSATKKIVKKLALNRETVRALGVKSALQTGVAQAGASQPASQADNKSVVVTHGSAASLTSQGNAGSGMNYTVLCSTAVTQIFAP